MGNSWSKTKLGEHIFAIIEGTTGVIRTLGVSLKEICIALIDLVSTKRFELAVRKYPTVPGKRKKPGTTDGCILASAESH